MPVAPPVQDAEHSSCKHHDCRGGRLEPVGEEQSAEQKDDWRESDVECSADHEGLLSALAIALSDDARGS